MDACNPPLVLETGLEPATIGLQIRRSADCSYSSMICCKALVLLAAFFNSPLAGFPSLSHEE